jgi:hypothetical protein
MNKLKGRVDKLFNKTHRFVSHRELCLARDYAKAEFDAIDKPEDLEEKFEQYLALNEKFKETRSAEILARLREICKTNQAVMLKFRYQWMAKICDEYPNGLSLPNKHADHYEQTIKNGKSYFKAKEILRVNQSDF